MAQHYACGDPLADYFTETARVRSIVADGYSSYDWWHWLRHNDPAWLVHRALALAPTRAWLEAGTIRQPADYLLREALYSIGCECTQFKASLGRAVWDFCLRRIGRRPSDARVLDPCAGWGDRLLGALSLGVGAYVGVDPNPLVHPGYAEAIRLLGGKRARHHQLVCCPFESYEGPGDFDVIFTSPPFGRYERYFTGTPDDLRQCNVRYQGEDWVLEWLIPVVRKMYSLLRPGGLLALYLSNSRVDAVYVPMLIKAMIDDGVPLAGKIWCIRRVRRRPLWLWQKT